MTFARAALIAVAALALGAYLASSASDFADTACWASSLIGVPSCS